MTAEESTSSVVSSSSTGIEQWDLTNTVSPYLDRHMIFPLLEFLDGLIAKEAVSYNSRDVAEARLALLRPTHMVDYAVDVYRSIHSDAGDGIPPEMEEQKQRVYQQLETLRAQCEPLDKLVKDEEQRVRLLLSLRCCCFVLFVSVLDRKMGELTLNNLSINNSPLRKNSLPRDSGIWVTYSRRTV
jgi:hypothetical protein